MAFCVNSIPDPDNRDFARQACQSIWEASIGRSETGTIEPSYLYADGTLSPNGEKYVAQRLYCSWMVHFDFSKGTVHRIRIQLPDECAGA
jgi:hypothetical protein